MKRPSRGRSFSRYASVLLAKRRNEGRAGCAGSPRTNGSAEDASEARTDGPRRPGGTSGPRMTATRTVRGFAGLLVLVPVTVCATIVYVDQRPLGCDDRKSPHQTLQKCRYDTDCMKNEYCWMQESCTCKEGFVGYRNHSHVSCLKVASSLGDPCIADIQCQKSFTLDSKCQNNACQCSAGSYFYEREKRCYKSAALGQFCETNYNCYVKNTYCKSSSCLCISNYHSNRNNSSCIKNIYLHEKCSYDEECVTEHTKCMQICTCKVDYVLSSSDDKCLKAANQIGDECEENSQCTRFLKNSECVKGTCRCSRNFHQRGPLCFENVELGKRCESHQQCVTPSFINSTFTDVMSVDCVNNYCVCAPDYTLAEDINDCIRYSDNGVTSLWSHCFTSIFIYLLVYVMRII